MENTFNVVFERKGGTIRLEARPVIMQTSAASGTEPPYVTSSEIVLSDPMSPKSLAEQVVSVYGRALERLADR